MSSTTKATLINVQLDDILTDIPWAKVSRRYFDKSSSWIHHKLNGQDGGFTAQEKEQLKEALNDFANRIKDCAEKI